LFRLTPEQPKWLPSQTIPGVVICRQPQPPAPCEPPPRECPCPNPIGPCDGEAGPHQ
jgi:hypothetical protein